MKKNYFWLACLVIVTIVFGTIYATVQQVERLNANDPQVQLATDAAHRLNGGQTPLSVIGDTVDLRYSLSPFVMVLDKSGKVVASSGVVGSDALTAPPLGVLTTAEGHEYNAVTWQPRSNLRLASVSIATKDYYVLSARSLKEVEKHESTTLLLTALGWLFSVATLGTALYSTRKK